MKYETTYRAWVYSIAALTDAGRRKYVMVHLHTYLAKMPDHMGTVLPPCLREEQPA